MQIGEYDSNIYKSASLPVCQNCGHRFPADRIQLHEAYCIRNYKKCLQCGLMVDKNLHDQHQKQLHEHKQCKYCCQKYQGQQLQQHQQQCFAKPQLCTYCNKSCPKGQLENHMKLCGMRNTQCAICKKLIPFREYESHKNRCQNRQEQRERRDISEQIRNIRATHQNKQRAIIRQNSQNRLQLQPLLLKQQKKQHQVKSNKIKPKHFIQMEQIKPIMDPIPISIQISMKMKLDEQAKHSELKHHQSKYSHQKHK